MFLKSILNQGILITLTLACALSATPEARAKNLVKTQASALFNLMKRNKIATAALAGVVYGVISAWKKAPHAVKMSPGVYLPIELSAVQDGIVPFFGKTKHASLTYCDINKMNISAREIAYLYAAILFEFEGITNMFNTEHAQKYEKALQEIFGSQAEQVALGNTLKTCSWFKVTYTTFKEAFDDALAKKKYTKESLAKELNPHLEALLDHYIAKARAEEASAAQARARS